METAIKIKNLIDNKLSHGVVTQNGTYISYKTDWYADNNSSFQKFHAELVVFLNRNKIGFKKDDFKIYKSDNSRSRLRCVTITVDIDKHDLSGNYVNAEVLPYENDCIN